MLATKQKGIVSELQCITYFYQLGYQVSIPYGENSRYDFIVDVDGHLLKMQCKTSSLKDEGAIKFSCRSTRVNATENISRRYTKDEIDYFCTFYEGKCYLVPVEECSVAKKLRFIPPKNGQVKGINFAKDYEAEVQIQKLKDKI